MLHVSDADACGEQPTADESVRHHLQVGRQWYVAGPS